MKKQRFCVIFDENMRFSCTLLSEIGFLRGHGQNVGLGAARVATGDAGQLHAPPIPRRARTAAHTSRKMLGLVTFTMQM